jgi:hypothetical protein
VIEHPVGEALPGAHQTASVTLLERATGSLM